MLYLTNKYSFFYLSDFTLVLPPLPGSKLRELALHYSQTQDHLIIAGNADYGSMLGNVVLSCRI